MFLNLTNSTRDIEKPYRNKQYFEILDIVITRRCNRVVTQNPINHVVSEASLIIR